MSSGVMVIQGRGSQTLCSVRWAVSSLRDTRVLLRAFLTPALGKKLPAKGLQSISLHIAFQSSRCWQCGADTTLLGPVAVHFGAIMMSGQYGPKSCDFTLAAFPITITGSSNPSFSCHRAWQRAASTVSQESSMNLLDATKSGTLVAPTSFMQFCVIPMAPSAMIGYLIQHFHNADPSRMNRLPPMYMRSLAPRTKPAVIWPTSLITSLCGYFLFPLGTS
jgi:hypothetical protein